MKNLLLTFSIMLGTAAPAADLRPVVQIEEDVYTYTNANNGAGPMWCHGSTCLVRSGEHLFASGLETVPDAKPLNNCRWILFERRADRWERVRVDEGRTREPCPLVCFPDGRVFLSINPTLGQEPEPGGGRARPHGLEFKAGDSALPPKPLVPVWQDAPRFTDHFFLTFVAVGGAKKVILL